jgi:hypothetical protein
VETIRCHDLRSRTAIIDKSFDRANLFLNVSTLFTQEIRALCKRTALSCGSGVGKGKVEGQSMRLQVVRSIRSHSCDQESGGVTSAPIAQISTLLGGRGRA